MKLIQQTEEEVSAVYKDWLYSYLHGDVKTYDSYFDDAFHFIGSTNNEEFLNRTHTTNFFKATAEQLSGKTQLRNETKIMEQFGELVFITHLFDAWFLNGMDWSFYGRFRFSNVLTKNKEGWRFVYQHYSTPDTKAQQGETIGIDQITKENLELREAIQRRTIELEEKNRELQIEAALERVRAKTMAMHNSSELADTSTLLDEQVRNLGIQTWGCAFHIYSDNDEGDFEWFSSANGRLPFYKTPRKEFFLDFYNRGKQGETFHVEEFAGLKCKAHYDYLKTIPLAGESLKALEESGVTLPTYQIDHIAFFKHGYILFITYNPVPEAHEVFQRFAKVFEQTYTRFLDLQKAEAQAREAKIEASLEKVRSRSLAMHKSEELEDVILVVSEQLQQLQFRFHNVSFGFNAEQMGLNFWLASPGLPKPLLLNVPYLDNPAFNRPIQARKNGVDFNIDILTYDENQQFLQHLFNHSMLGSLSTKSKNFLLGSPGIARSQCLMKNTILTLGNYNLIPYSKDQNAILKRFGNVFEQAYTRFLDLKKAEAQTRESEIELALERVRARTMAMQKSDELKEVIQTVYDQFIKLNINIDHTGFIIDYKDREDMLIWLADKNGIPSPQISIPYFDSPHWNSFIEAKKKGNHFFTNQLDFQTKNKFYKQLFKLIPEIPKKTIDFCLACPALSISTVLMENVGLYIENFNGFTYTTEENEVLMRIGKVFQQTYTRFLDLQKAEAQALLAAESLEKLKIEKQRAEEALSELQQTQKQLIQSEKMASLGELTAGIAHEIQNPLNFVNNFSEVSNELVDEMNEELDKGDLEEAKAISLDIKHNLEKINHHGKRADNIVKGMLQHSRSSSGTIEPTDINTLADEYLRLAYHGLRAKDKSFNAKLVTKFDESIGLIPIIPQDMGRVILNLITNAFYAVNEKKQNLKKDFEPTVTIITQKKENNMELHVKDNGNGIPESVKEKIFQPFFTTKPTGQGTGLGLSMSYDIIKAHGGELTVKTKEGEGTTFCINLPIMN